MRGSVAALLLSVLAASASARLPPDTTPLNRWTAIMTHNSATGEDTVNSAVCDNQGMHTISQQLDCGAWALDYRPLMESSGGAVLAHHSSSCIVNVQMSTSVQNIINWLANNPNELVILYVSHFLGTNGVTEQTVKEASALVLSTKGVSTIRWDQCGQLAGLTIGGVKQRSALPNGGYLLAVYDGGGACMDEQWPGDNYGGVKYNDFTNYDNYMSASTDFPNADFATSGKLYMVQAFWQQDISTVFRSGGIVGEEQSTNLNAYTKGKVESGAYYFANFIEVNNVCHDGSALKLAIDAFYNNIPVSNCLNTNKQLSPGQYIQSNNGLHRARLDSDGRLCVYSSSNMNDPHWCTETVAPTLQGGPGMIKTQTDGNVMMYTPTKNYYWNANTFGAGMHLKLQNDRNLVVYYGNGEYGGWACGNRASNSCYYFLENDPNCVNCADNDCRTLSATTSPMTPSPTTHKPTTSRPTTRQPTSRPTTRQPTTKKPTPPPTRKPTKGN